MEPKIDPGAMSEKSIQKGRQNGPFWHHFGSQNRSKINEKIDAKIDAKKVMKNEEKMMQKVIKIQWKIDAKFSRLQKNGFAF